MARRHFSSQALVLQQLVEQVRLKEDGVDIAD